MRLKIVPAIILVVAASASMHNSHHCHTEPYQRREEIYHVNQARQPMSTELGHDGRWGHHEGWQSPWSHPTSSTAAEASSAPAGSDAPPASHTPQIGSPTPDRGSSSALSAVPSYSSPSNPSAPKSSDVTGGAGAAGYGISYAPYNGDGSCKTASEIKQDFQAFEGYGQLRIYGTDCDQVANVLPAASARNMKLFAGIWDVGNVADEAQLIIDAAKGDWRAIDTISVGNEVINSGSGTVDQVVSAVKQAKSILSAAGFAGNVVTVDTSDQIINNPQLCEVSDFAAANCHAFFDASVTASGAGAYVKKQAQLVQQACGGKNTIITESGWPWKGESNGAAVPSKANQKAAIGSLRNAFSRNIILFSAFNDAWKQDYKGTFGTEKYWGIYGNAPSG